MTSDGSPGALRRTGPIETRFEKELRELLGPRVDFGVPLSKHTSLRVGGPADALARPQDLEELQALLGLCSKLGGEPVLLGGGFNLLVSDAGVAGVVVQLQALRELDADSEGRITAQAGTSHSRLVRFAAERGRSGLEFGVGIPGTVGGWVAMTAGIPSVEVKDVVERVDWIAPDAGGIRELPRADLDFSYRSLELPRGAAIVRAVFRTESGEPAAIRAQMRELLARRRETPPVDQRSCGSVFKNPPGDRAARLIDSAGLKGTRSGSATISQKHANFIETRGDATAADVLALIELARSEVASRFGIELETEVRFVGRSPGGLG